MVEEGANDVLSETSRWVIDPSSFEVIGVSPCFLCECAGVASTEMSTMAVVMMMMMMMMMMGRKVEHQSMHVSLSSENVRVALIVQIQIDACAPDLLVRAKAILQVYHAKLLRTTFSVVHRQSELGAKGWGLSWDQ
jgi:hypothetical protein